MIKGVDYAYRHECCIKHGLKYSNVVAYARSHNLDFDEALNLYIAGDVLRGRTTPVRVNGVEYDSIISCCNDYDVKYETVSNFKRRYKLDSMEDALISYCSKRRTGKFRTKNCNFIEIGGKSYSSVKDCCRAYDISYPVVKSIADTSSKPDYRSIIVRCIRDRYLNVYSEQSIKKIKLLDCSCKACKQRFLFTEDLCIKHIDECCIKIGGEKDE